MHPTTDNECTEMGWFEFELVGGEFDLHVSVPPEADLDGEFIAFCHDEQEMIVIQGWNFTALAI